MRVGLAHLKALFALRAAFITLPKIQTELMKTTADRANCLQGTASPLRLQFGKKMMLVESDR